MERICASKNIQTDYKKNFLQTLILKHDEHQKIKNQSKKKNNNTILLAILDYLDLKDILNIKFVCKTISYEINETIIKSYIKKFGMFKDDVRNSYLKLWTKFTNYSR